MLEAALRLGPKGIAHVWPDPALSTLRAMREAGIPIVREMINSHVGYAKQILDAEYRQIGLPPGHAITDQAVEHEIEALKLCDYVFCPSPMVEKSVTDQHVLPSKVRSLSFGWDPTRFAGQTRALAPVRGTTFIFVGNICVRKGAHLLLRYWAKSGIPGRLVLVGAMEPAIEKVCADELRRDDVIVVKHTLNIGDYYRSADVFAFPSLEEGAPLVTFEAAGCGLPLVVSPMGAARVADDSTGYVLDPFDEEGWTEAMRKLAQNAELRREMGAEARRRSLRFTWSEVSRPRGEFFAELARRQGNLAGTLSHKGRN